MKKIYLIMLTVFLNVAMFSCTPQALTDTSKATEQATEDCCDEEGDIPPPPPPPPPPTTGG